MIPHYAIVNALLNHRLGFGIIACGTSFDDLTHERTVSYPGYVGLQSMVEHLLVGLLEGSVASLVQFSYGK